MACNEFLPSLRNLIFPELWPETALSNGDVIPNELFHYTSAEACFSILDVRRPNNLPELWASSALCTNDSSEIEHGLEKDHFPKFSKMGDS